MTDWKPVATALLGSWPSQVAAWGKEGIAAYLAELEARGVTPEAALVGIRSFGAEQKFPPSAPELAGLARRDPSVPTFDEMVRLVWGNGGVLRASAPYPQGGWRGNERRQADDAAALDRASSMHPRIAGFVERVGLPNLRALNLEDPEWGGAHRRRLRMAWDEFMAASEGREVASLASARRGEIGRLDPLAALGVPVTHQLAGAKVETEQ